MLTRGEKIGRHVDGMATGLDRLDRRAGGNAAHHWHGNGTATVIFRARTHPAEIALDDTWGETPRAAGHHALGDRFRQFDYFDGARPVRQAADEAALLERRDEAMNAGLGTQ